MGGARRRSKEAKARGSSPRASKTKTKGSKAGSLPFADAIVREACLGNGQALRLMLSLHGSEVLSTRDNIQGCMLARI